MRAFFLLVVLVVVLTALFAAMVFTFSLPLQLTSVCLMYCSISSQLFFALTCEVAPKK